MNRRTLCQALGALGLAGVAGRDSAQATAGETTPRAASEIETVCGQTVSLRLHETMTTGSGVTIRLNAIKDHRCPVGVECVWAGYAEIWLDLSGPRWAERGYPATEYFTIGLEDSGVRRYGPYVLIIDTLSPTPRPSIETSPDEYEVGLVLIELTER
ncbi:MAG: hypothetical protein ACRDJH_05945 [Thermomicrobiales bacterium]